MHFCEVVLVVGRSWQPVKLSFQIAQKIYWTRKGVIIIIIGPSPILTGGFYNATIAIYVYLSKTLCVRRDCVAWEEVVGVCEGFKQFEERLHKLRKGCETSGHKFVKTCS